MNIKAGRGEIREMFLHGQSAVTPDGELTIGGMRATELAAEFGTPLFVYDEEFIRERARAYRRPFERARVPYRIAYACKAFCTVAMSQLAMDEGLWLDVVSGGELYTALAAGADPKRILMHGNNKTREELRYAVECGIAQIVVDNFREIELLDETLAATGGAMDVLLRVSPGVDAHTHEFISTGKQDSKFGFDLYSGQVEEAVESVLAHSRLRLLGLHSHIGSQIFDKSGFELAAQRLAERYASLEKKYGITLQVLNLGGGLGVRYTEDDAPPPIEAMVEGILGAVRAAFSDQEFALPLIMLEPGRSLVAEAGTTLYRIGSEKEVPDVRRYIAVDGGMTDNPRLALYGAKYECALANRMHDKAVDTFAVAGKCCESGDMLIWEAKLPQPAFGDILAVSSTGAYNYSMASNYNRIPRPAVVFVRDGRARLVVRRETYEDLIRLDIGSSER